MANILVTGASGFVAEHLIPKLKEGGNVVIGHDRKKQPSAICDKFISGDLCDLQGSDLADHNVDSVIHLAAARADWGVSKEEFYRDNVTATENLLYVLKETSCKEYIFVSSISTMPQVSIETLDESSPYSPVNYYGSSKMEAEQLFIRAVDENKQIEKLVIIRPTVIYGPSDPNKTGIYRATDNNIFRVIDGIAKKRFAIVGDGGAVKTTAYVKNFVEALIFLLDNQFNNKSELFIYADQPPLTTESLVKIVRKELGLSSKGMKVPAEIILPFASVCDWFSNITDINIPITKARIETFMRNTNVSSDKLLSMGFEFPHTTEEALHETIKWYKELVSSQTINSFFVRKEN